MTISEKAILPGELNILLIGRNETIKDFLSSNYRTGMSPALNLALPPLGNIIFGRIRFSGDIELRLSSSCHLPADCARPVATVTYSGKKSH